MKQKPMSFRARDMPPDLLSSALKIIQDRPATSLASEHSITLSSSQWKNKKRYFYKRETEV